MTCKKKQLSLKSGDQRIEINSTKQKSGNINCDLLKYFKLKLF